MRRSVSARLAAVVATTVLVLVASCTSTSKHGGSTTSAVGPGGGSGLSAGVAGKKVTFIVYATASTPFFNPVVNGAKAAADAYGLNLTVQYSNSDIATQNNQIQTAVAGGVDALALSISDNNAFTKTVCAAKQKNIPVVAFNVSASSGPVLDCTLSFVGQDFQRAGALIAQRLINDGKIKSGDKVACPVEDASAVYAVQRGAGANQALASVGVKCDEFSVGFDLAKAQTTLQQYLVGHSDTKAVLALGLVPLQVTPAAASEAHVSVAIGGFDLSPQISDDIKAGKIDATVNQQPYLQGFYAVQQLALRMKYGLTPANYDTGNALVDASNVGAVAKLAGTVF